MLTKPKIALVGTFNQLLVDGMESLEMKYDICDGPSDCNTKYDIVIIGENKLEEAELIVAKMEAVPVLRRSRTAFVGFDAIKETGNAFTYDGETAWHIMEALIRAQETFRFKYDWKTVKGNLLSI